MNLTLLDRDQLEAILLNPSSEAAQPLVCSDNAVVAYLPVPATARDGRLRHVLAAAHELLTRIAAEAIRGRSLIDSPTVMKDFLRVYFAGAERETFMSEVAVPRLAALQESNVGRARPWFEV